MFIKDVNRPLVFIKSKNIDVFPCGRRRSLIDSDGEANTVTDRYYIPFDPEARLNTESNNRKHSSLNGYKQSYLKNWNEEESLLTIVIAGYLFTIRLASEYSTVEAFGKALEMYLAGLEKVYVNIKIADVEFFSGTSEIDKTFTKMLRDQSLSDIPEACLDLLIPEQDKTKGDSYYFSGLSFSNIPLEGDDVTSLLILTKTDSGWSIHEPAYLPEVDHGDLPNSVRVDTLQVTNNLDVDGIITAEGLEIAGKKAITLEVVQKDPAVERYQLQFFKI